MIHLSDLPNAGHNFSIAGETVRGEIYPALSHSALFLLHW